MNVIHAADFVMQAMFISACAWLVVLFLKRAERKARAALIGILACAVMPWFSAWIPARRVELPRPQVIRVELPTVREVTMPAAPEPIVLSAGVREETPMAAPRKLDPAKGLFIVWLCGSLAGLAIMLRELWITRRWMRTLVGPDERQSDLLRAAGFHGRDRLLISRDGPGPCVAGFFKPVVVAPAWLLEIGRERELEWSLRHELEHLRGHDSRWVLLIRLVRCFQWWNPFMHLLARSWDQSRERVCDLRAMRHPEDVPDYGLFLLVVAARNPGRIAAASMACGRPAKRLRRRIASLLKSGPAKPAPAGAGWSIAVAVLLLGVSVVSAGFGFAGEKVAEAKDDDDLSWLEPKPVMRISATAIISPKPISGHGGLVTNEEAQALLDRCERMKNCHVTSLGNGEIDGCAPLALQFVATRDPNKIVDPPWDGVKRVNDFVGWVLHCIPEESDGDDPALRLKAAYAFAPGFHPAPNSMPLVQMPRTSTTSNYSTLPAIFPEDSGWDQVAIKTGECRSRIQPASNLNLFLSLGEVESGVFAACLLKITSRMPWEGWSYTIRNGYVRPFGHEVLDWILTDEQKKTQLEIDESRSRFMKKVDSLPDNKNLLMLRTKTELALKAAREAKDLKEANRFNWMIHQIREKMWKNAPQELKHEDTLLMMRQGNLNELMNEPENRKRINEILKKRNEANGVIIKEIRRR